MIYISKPSNVNHYHLRSVGDSISANNPSNANAYVYAWGDGSSNDNVAESGSPAGSVGGANITHDYSSQNAGSYTLTMTGSGQPDLTVQSDNDTVVFSLENVPAKSAST